MNQNLKEVLLGSISAGISVLAFWYWNTSILLFTESGFHGYRAVILPVLLLILAGAFWSLSAIFIKNKRILYTFGTIGLAAPYIFIPATVPAIILLIISVLLGLISFHHINDEFIHSLGFSLTKVIKTGLPIFFTASSLIISTYYLANLNQEKSVATFLPKPVFDLTLKIFAGPLKSLTGLPEFKPEETADELLGNIVRKQFQDQGIPASRISNEELRQALALDREVLARQYGLKFKGSEKVTDVLSRAINERIGGLLGSYVKYLPFASALTFFLAFKTLTLPLYYLTLLCAFLLLKLMIVSKIIKREKMQMEVERLTM